MEPTLIRATIRLILQCWLNSKVLFIISFEDEPFVSDGGVCGLLTPSFMGHSQKRISFYDILIKSDRLYSGFKIMSIPIKFFYILLNPSRRYFFFTSSR